MSSLRPRAAASRFFLVPLLAIAAHSKGIAVRFLACPPEDSIVRYGVWRSDGAGAAPALLGEIAAAGSDTLEFLDTAAAKGRAYAYSVTAVNAGGLASDPSEATRVGFPRLSLPDTLRLEAGRASNVALPPSADPLEGEASLLISLRDSSGFTLTYDASARSLAFRARGAKGDTALAVVRAQYFGKFGDADSLWILAAAAAPVGLPQARPGGAGAASRPILPARYSPRTQGPVAIGNTAVTGFLEIADPLGAVVSSLPVPGGGARWDGRDRNGSYLKPARYLWLLRDASGAPSGSGFLLIEP
jgi:hypothetical protein